MFCAVRIVLARAFLPALLIVAIAVPTATPVPTLVQAATAPELPRVYLDTTYVPPMGTTIAVPAGGDFQAALNTAQPGDVITLQAGATYTGPFILPNKSGSGWIVVRTSAPDSSLPAPGTRITPAYAPSMPKIVVGSGVGAALRAASGAHHFRFIGIEFAPTPGAFVYSLIDLGTGETSTAALPHDLIFDRCYIHGDPTAGGRRGIAMNSAFTAVIDSYLSGFKEVGNDSQTIMSWNGAGPFKITNNYLEGAGENVMFGGADPSISYLVPSDIEIRGNYFFKPTSWRVGDPSYAGTHWTVKNLLEFKNVHRVLVDGNVFEHNWLDAQNGSSILFTVRNQDGTAPWSVVEDMTFTHNIVRHVARGFYILGYDDIHQSEQTKRILIQDNVFDDVGGTWGMGRLFQTNNGAADIAVNHNTAFQTENMSSVGGSPQETGFVFTNNIMSNTAYGFSGDGTAGNPLLTLTTYFPGYTFARNVFPVGTVTAYPPDNVPLASLDLVGFANLAGGDYHLASTSLYKNAGTDGKDIGADIDAVLAATANAVTGGGSSGSPPPTLSVTPSTAVDFGSVTVGGSADRSFTVTNAGGGMLSGTTSTAAPFSVVSGSAFNLSAGASQMVVVRFIPGAVGGFSGTASFDSNGGATSRALTGTGVVAADTTPPAISMTAPPAGTTVSGAITVSATATDNVGVAGVQFILDGAALGPEDTVSPYAATWDTTTATNGSHTLAAVARDAAGNQATSAAVSVTVSNSLVDTTPPAISSVAVSSVTTSDASITWTTNEPSDSQTEYGLTTSYGSASPVDASKVTAHVVILNGLTVGTTYHYRVKSRDAASNLAISADFTFATAAATTAATAEAVVWKSLVNVTATGNSLQKTSGCDGCADAGAISQQQISAGDGYVEFTASETTTFRAIGLSNGNPGTSRDEIIYSIGLWPGGGADIREYGNVYRTETTYLPGDVFRIAVESGVVRYYKNGQLLYTSSLPSTYPLLVDTSVWNLGATITNVVMSGSAAATPSSTPFTGTPYPVPGQIEAENFDNGGEGVAYHDLTLGNQGGAYRTDIDVDIVAPPTGGYVVNGFQTGEWLKYTISVAQTGTYRIDALVSSEFTTSRWHADVDGVNVTGSVSVPNTGSWNTFKWVGGGGVPLAAGQHVIRISADEQYFNFAAFRILARTNYKGTPFAVPGQIEAEDFDNGWEGLAYHDLTPGNAGGQYRTNVDVDIISPSPGMYVVNDFQTGEWLAYTIDVAQSGTYRIEALASSEFPTRQWHAAIDGMDVTGPVLVPNTGWWGTFQWTGQGGVTLTAGQHTLTVYADEQYFNLDSIRIVAESASSP